jgi:hypothetical protein
MKEEQEENVLSESNTEQKDNPKNEEIQNKVKTEMSQLIYYDFSLK